MKTYRILLVDDHTVVRQGLKQILEEGFSPIVFGEARNVGKAIDLALRRDWDVVILDITLPGRSGMEFLKEIKRRRPGLPVLVLSMHSEEQYAVRTVKAGAAGYMTKECAPSDLIAAVRELMKGRKYIVPSVADKLIMSMEDGKKETPHERLSNREYEIMRLIASGKRLSEIAQKLSLSPTSVSTYRCRLLKKMRLKNNAELTSYAVRHGLAG